tara:strand:- start:171 stop:794 length:624 start_codon:yes stop_codon:yes gene_type:complete
LNRIKTPIILFGNGKVPSHISVLKRINNANTILCVDGGIDKLIRLGYKPDLIIGDLDSLKLNTNKYTCDVVRLADQSKTDLEKSLIWCKKNKICDITLIGFSELRDDHFMATLWTMMVFSSCMNISLLSDYSMIYCLNGKSKFKTKPNQIISIISNNPKTTIKTSGLKFELNDECLSSYSEGISNIALGEQIEVDTNDWIWLFINHI